ncbi:MAG: shikimate dehydrogenase [Helicobacteraceae bacterium]|jgi:shikimate dehydrogenase|nr:shikimate dehydrogenase [Helicobacteraceae bacterium]
MKLLAVLGDPIAHSLSPLMHNYVYQKNAIDAIYTRLRIADGKRLREVFEANDLYGANITVPHKEEAFRLADEVSQTAEKIGAVNTWVRNGARIIGHNTDAEGFMSAAAIKSGETALVLGAGGAARAVAIALLERGIDFAVLNRSADRLAFFERCGARVFLWENPPNERFDLIINTTSAGLKDDSLPLEINALENYLKSAKGAFDLIYGKKTPFLRLAEALGVKAQDGEDMLVFQGAIAHSLFFGGDRTKIAQDMKTALRFPTLWL